ncbi:MAG: imidazole glycerol phosphate synthase subunit HisH [Clostridia bacterium]|uniref:Imidazole glycerol phosphate synthase subunit HisH n=1 Tax=Mogibacterium kristiansenii TaxID=2606708 RepID=A0A6N7XF61_9FIRM|nr:MULTISPECIES: imidazole glycerol phosphate synthase subunit HisH [Mogibacterium]MCI7123426.1 imidazole glycerol phosphate synthase subunit HisH [Mogibacterium sp.]MDY5449859.1 imidazole glycerol phosphate synthase subunit HisH [Clostridia bacterium]MST69868.1 imidazole glycerol phosphate synthase subunit HisH [Mogibacterium kristiansenii]
MIRIIDYGVGNLFSLRSSLRAIGIDADYTGNPAEIRKADKLILPGVGAFRDAREALRSTGLDRVVQEEAGKGKPLMGICLGMQMLFDRSYEYGEYEGLGLIPGEIVPMEGRIPKDLPIPHIGWNELMLKQPSPLMKNTANGDYVYFVHSYYAETPAEYVIATTDYGVEMTAAVQKDNVSGCQFHPEKSSEVGLSILKAFCEL